MSRLGNPALQAPKPTGAARFAAPLETVGAQSVPASKHKNITMLPGAGEKERTTLYLPLDVQERFADLRRQLRRRGIKPRDASNSALVVRVFREMSDDDLLELF